MKCLLKQSVALIIFALLFTLFSFNANAENLYPKNDNKTVNINEDGTKALIKPKENAKETYIVDKTSMNTMENLCGNKESNLQPYGKQYISIISENDAYYNPYIDRYYTAGNRIGYISKENDYYCQIYKHKIDPIYKRSKLWWLSKISAMRNRHLTRWDISLAQEMYTPKDFSAPMKNEIDYPYSGYLYLAFGFSNRDENTEENFKLQLGIVGPASLAQATQDFIHKAFGVGSKLPGWDSQVGNEPIFNLYYQITKKYYLFNTKYFSSDILPSLGAALGNANIYVDASFRLRMGYNLNSDFGISRINHTVDAAPPHNDDFSIYIFGGVGGRFVIKNIFISGNTFGKGTGLDITRFVYDLEGGVAIMVRGVRLSYTFTHRGQEFKHQPGDMDYSSISLQVGF